MAAPMPMAMESPDAGKIKTGLLIAGIGLLLSSFIFVIGAVLSLFSGTIGFGFAFVGTLIVFIGGLVAFMGTKAYPKGRTMAGAGMALLLVGVILGITSWAMAPTFLLATDPLAYLNALATSIIIGFVAYLLMWIGVLVLPLRLMTGAGKGLAIAGAVLGIVGVVLVVALPYAAILATISALQGGSTVDAGAALLAAVVGFLLGLLAIFIGSILAGVGYIIGRGKLVPAGGAM